MSNLTDTIRGKVIAGNNKYTNQQEKRATVIEANKEDNRCVISTINRDGIVQVYYNVPVLYTTTDKTNVSWFPKDGEQVMVTEKNKGYTITGPFVGRPNVAITYDFYSMGTDDADGNLQ